MKKFLLVICLVLIVVAGLQGWYIFNKLQPVKPQPTPKPLLVYTFENLKKTNFPATQITLGAVLNQDADSISQIFYFSVPKTPGSKTMLKVSGLMNLPKKPGNYPLIVMFRGFIPDNQYQPGSGTQPSAAVFAKNGFITLAPDFLGFGQSASPSADSFENRFQTYTTALSLLASLKTLDSALTSQYPTTTADLSKVGIWGHSNGGHIALATLAISGVTYPTVLWAPVSASFPYSILYYTDESDDQGKALRRVLANFEQIYNTDDFSPANYYAWIKAPIQLNQGLSDEEVPYWWSDNLAATFKKDNISVSYITYPNSDHNFLPAGWSDAVKNSMTFFNQQFSK
jgi:dipeptidyl aminopeptidase/acylaminoacyl peptidase